MASSMAEGNCDIPAGDFGVYVHYPLCRHRCGYCDFPTVQVPSFPQREYTDQVIAELQLRAPEYRRLRLRSIYLGGGTPSLWPVDLLAGVLERTLELFELDGPAEVTLEANPGTLDLARLRGLRQAGVNRLSLGTQALDDELLRRLDRDHTAAQARSAVELARRAGFDNVSCDLIFGLGGQDLASHLEQLRRLIALQPDHVSLYALTLARGSALWRGGARVVDDDVSADMLQAGRALLAEAGLVQYEVSNYAAPGRRSQHNLRVWQGRPYLGVGAAAHSLWLEGDRHVRLVNPPFSRYLDAREAEHDTPPLSLQGTRRWRLDRETSQFELMMLGLRTTEGVDRRVFTERFGRDPEQLYAEGLAKLSRAGMLGIDRERIRPTAKGIWFADELARQL